MSILMTDTLPKLKVKHVTKLSMLQNSPNSEVLLIAATLFRIYINIIQ